MKAIKVSYDIDDIIQIIVSQEIAETIVKDLVTFLKFDHKHKLAFGISKFLTPLPAFDSHYMFQLHLCVKKDAKSVVFSLCVQIPFLFLLNRSRVRKEHGIKMGAQVSDDTLTKMELYRNLYDDIIELSLEKLGA